VTTTTRIPEAPRPRAGAEPTRDLAGGNPDPALLPPLRPALDVVDTGRPAVDNVASVLPGLVDYAGERFARDGVPVRDIAVCSGALDAMERVLNAHLAPGARVAVEDPGYPPVFFLLASLGLKAVPVAVDEQGPSLDGLAEAARSADALVVTPRAQNPTGAATTPERGAAARAILREHPQLLVIEDDHASDIAGPESAVTLVDDDRARWAVIRSASKSLGADLRVAVAATDPSTMAMLRGRQRRGPGWVSGLLQQIVLRQWTDPESVAQLRAARAAYAERRGALVAALAERGVAATGRSGLNVWVPVADEDAVVASARAAGFAIAPGRRYRRSSPPAVRVTISTLRPDEAPAVAEAIAAAARRTPSVEEVRS
jgi:DNA-binding transcriptional MocR family regulator